MFDDNFNEDVGLLVSGKSLPVRTVSVAPFAVEIVEVATMPLFSPSDFPPKRAPSLGAGLSESSPSAVLYHWHLKSFFQISAGSGSAALLTLSG